MNTAPGSPWNLLGVVGLEVLLIVSVVFVLTHRTKTAVRRRDLWHACVCGLCLLTGVELTGIGRDLVAWTRTAFRTRASAPRQQPMNYSMPLVSVQSPPPMTTAAVAPGAAKNPTEPVGTNAGVGSAMVQSGSGPAPEINLPVLGVRKHPANPKEHESLSEARGATQLPGAGMARHTQAERPASGAVLDVPEAQNSVVGWVGLVWLAGTIVVLLRLSLAHGLLLHLCLGRRAKLDVPTQTFIVDLARRLDIRQRIRTIRSGRLSSPISFGIWRPTLGIPANFEQQFSPAQREAVLAHELAHLSSRDPLWYLVADFTSAWLWWHPLIWWARGQLHSACEAAADEASLVVRGGPAALAECLIALGKRLLLPRRLAWTAIEGSGFRSSLGRRVERLINLQGPWPGNSQRALTKLAKTVGPLGLVAILILSTAWAVPQALNQGANMQIIRQSWKHPLVAFFLAVSVGGDRSLVAAGDASEPNTNATPGIEAADAPPENAAAPRAVQMSPEMLRRYGLSPTPKQAQAGQGYASQPLLKRYGLAAGKQTIFSQLERIVFDEVSLPPVINLGAVTKYLANEALRRDPEHRGINFIVSGPHTAPAEKEKDKDEVSGLDENANEVGLARLREFCAEQDKKVSELRQRLADMLQKNHINDADFDNGGATLLNTETVRRLLQESVSASATYTQMKQLYDELAKMPKDKLRQALTTAFPDTSLTELLSRYTQIETELAALQKEYGPNSPNIIREHEILTKLDQQINDRIEGILTGLKVRVNALKSEVDDRTKALDQAKLADHEYAAKVGEYIVAKKELESQERILETLRLRLVQETVDSKLPKNARSPQGRSGTRNAQPLDLYDVQIALGTPLHHVNLKDLLEVLCKVAQVPLKYSVEDYGVVFALKTAGDDSPGESVDPLAQRYQRYDSRRYAMSAAMRRRYGLPPEEPETASASESLSPNRQAIQTLIRSVTFESLDIPDGLPLKEVVKLLTVKARKRDPKNAGINFLITKGREAAATATVDPTTGLPISVPVPDPEDLPVHLNLPLRNVTLEGVLDALTKVVTPAIKYTVEDYGVLLALAPERQTPEAMARTAAPGASQIATEPGNRGELKVRTFKLDKKNFCQGLEQAFGIRLEEGQALTSQSISSAMSQLSRKLGISLSGGQKAVYFNDLTGVLMVRATGDDLAVLQAVIETLGGSAIGVVGSETAER